MTSVNFSVSNEQGFFCKRIDLSDQNGRRIEAVRSYSSFARVLINIFTALFCQKKKIIEVKDIRTRKIHYVNKSSLQKREALVTGLARPRVQTPVPVAQPARPRVQTPVPVKPQRPAPVAAPQQAAQRKSGPVKVVVNRDVLKKQYSDHAIVRFETSDGTIISSNIMCSGEDHNRAQANSFGIDPCEKKGREQRFQNMIQELAKTAAGQTPIIALQEFPRRTATGNKEFSALLRQNFPNHKMVFGAVEGGHENSQLCFLVPKDAHVRVVTHSHTRVQALVINNIGYINIHPQPHKSNSADSFQTDLKNLCQRMGCEQVHIVGDWNRQRNDLALHWTNIASPDKDSHYPPYQHMADFKAGRKNGPKPIDHHVLWIKS